MCLFEQVFVWNNKHVKILGLFKEIIDEYARIVEVSILIFGENFTYKLLAYK